MHGGRPGALTDNPQFRHIEFAGTDGARQLMEAVTAGMITGTLFQSTYGMADAGAKAVRDKCKVAEDAPFAASLPTKRMLESQVRLVTKDNIAQFPTASIPSDTARLIDLLDHKAFKCCAHGRAPAPSAGGARERRPRELRTAPVLSPRAHPRPHGARQRLAAVWLERVGVAAGSRRLAQRRARRVPGDRPRASAAG